MKALKARAGGGATQSSASDYRTNQGTVKVFSKTVDITTTERTEVLNLSDQVRAFVESTGIEDGYLQMWSLHTTAGLFVNEWQDALLIDIRSMIERIVPRDTYYRHNDPEFSDCDRYNGDSHLRNVVFGRSLLIPVAEGKLVLGRWQSVLMAEFDGPNQRQVFLQVFGI
jgi:secondary thiamine-phosphate synthase enzyme